METLQCEELELESRLVAATARTMVGVHCTKGKIKKTRASATTAAYSLMPDSNARPLRLPANLRSVSASVHKSPREVTMTPTRTLTPPMTKSTTESPDKERRLSDDTMKTQDSAHPFAMQLTPRVAWTNQDSTSDS